MNTRGLRLPSAGCALTWLSTACIASGRDSDSTKQGNVAGLGNAFSSAATSTML
jgi:hypothetical protein